MHVGTIGLDLAKNVFQVHGIDGDGRVVVRQRLKRSEMLSFFSALGPCLIGMEACSTAHHWARELMAFGLDVRLMPASYVKPYASLRPDTWLAPDRSVEIVIKPLAMRRTSTHDPLYAQPSSNCNTSYMPSYFTLSCISVS